MASYDVSVTENCNAGDTVSGVVRWAVSVSEAVEAAETMTQAADWNVINSVGVTTWTPINSSMSP